MWPTASLWGNALIFAAIGFGGLVCAELGRVLGASAGGRKALRRAPIVLACLIVVYVGLVLVVTPRPAPQACPYNAEHPSEC